MPASCPSGRHLQDGRTGLPRAPRSGIAFGVLLRSLTLDELHIEDERSFRHVALYAELKQALRRDGYRFRVPPRGARLSWDRALFLNLTFWDGSEQGDVL